jgi:hypothetical protein
MPSGTRRRLRRSSASLDSSNPSLPKKKKSRSRLRMLMVLSRVSPRLFSASLLSFASRTQMIKKLDLSLPRKLSKNSTIRKLMAANSMCNQLLPPFRDRV